MVFSWFKDERRKELLAEPFPAEWHEFLAGNVRHYRFLEPAGQAAVQAVVQVMVAEKHWSGGARFVVSDEMKVTVAAQAALLTLGLDEPYYFDRAQSIILYPGAYYHQPQMRQYGSVFTGIIPLAGEAWYHSPIVLSWEHVLKAGRDQSNGNNVVLHEFAHHLDGLDGEMEGTPPLVDRELQNTWYRVTEAEYRRLVGSVRRGEVTLLDHYGATNRAEFFAVATESFFERPHALRSEHAELYAVLRDFYLQDPAEWLPDADVTAAEDEPAASEQERAADAAMLQSDDAEAVFMFGVACMEEDRFDLAEEAASRVIQLDPNDAEAYQQRAAARVKLGKFAEALDDSDKAIEFGDSDEFAVDAYRIRGGACVGLKKYDWALEDLNYVLQQDKDDAEARLFRGAAFLGLGRYRKALSDLSAAIRLNEFTADAYLQRALAYRALNRNKEAEADIEKALQLDPEITRRV
jgi:MtfA peptidase